MAKTLSIRIDDNEEETLSRYLDALHHRKDADFFHTLFSVLARKDESEVVDFFYTERKPSNPFYLPHCGYASCGEWVSCDSESGRIDIGADVARKLGVRESDFLVEARGTSMNSDHAERDIVEGAWLIMRSGIEAQGRATLFSASMPDGQCLWTLKWHLSEQGKPAIKNGRGKVIKPPAGAEEVRAHAVCIGVINSI